MLLTFSSRDVTDAPVRLMPALSIGSPCCTLASCRNMLMLLSVSGMLYVWYVPPTVYPIVMWTD